MRVHLDARVRTRDGGTAGSVQRAVINPRTNELTDLVISTGIFLGRAVLVPREAIERAAADGDAIRLRLSKPELETLPTYRPAAHIAPPASRVAPVGYAFPFIAYIWPAGGPAALRPAGPGAGDATPAGAAESPTIPKGALVIDGSGEDIGVVDDVWFAAGSGRLSGFVLRLGGALRTLLGGGNTVEVSAGEVDHVGECTVHLTLTKAELEQTPR